MIICIKNGNIFNSEAHAIVNCVNTQGIMGKGLALLYKKKYPDMFLAYREACLAGEIRIGFMHLWKMPDKNKWIINFPTKNKWQENSEIQWIIEGLKDLAKVVRENKIQSLAIPALGCGLGGLSFDLVKKEIFQVFEKNFSDVSIELYEPN
jgi:O-acetyl-ADP-ribose deacetylase (regulator of RNase III)